MPATLIEHAFQAAAVLQQTGRFTEAERAYRQILVAQPGYLPACVGLGNTLSAMGRWPEAVDVLERALKFDSSRPEIHFNLGNNHAKRGQWEPAVASYRQALALRPNCAKTWTNLAGVLMEQEHLDEAVAHFQRAVQLYPLESLMHYNLGVALARSGRGEEAITCYRQAIELQPDYANAHWALAPELLRHGQYEEGWRVYARHGRCPGPNPFQRNFAVPPWDGTHAEGETILVHEEQGNGDAIQFLRYVTLLRERSRAARVIIECPAPLCRLFQQSDICRGMIIEPRKDPDPIPPACDRHISFLDLPFVLRQWEPLPMTQPYLQSPTGCARGSGSPRLQVGLVWAGNPRQLNDRRRSLPPEKLLPLFRTPNVDFHSLQVRPEGGPPAFLTQAGLVDRTASITDFADTAALLQQLDLVITVDTSVAHLAGALGRPTWTLLAFVADWRWGLKGEDTPWYPSMRLFRQPALGDWDAVIRRVGEELSTLTGTAKKRSS